MRRVILAVSAALLPAIAVAQQQPDLNDVLRAIQNLGNEVRGIREDVDRLKNANPNSGTAPSARGSSGATTAPQQPAAEARPAASAQRQMRPGWVVAVHSSPINTRPDWSVFEGDELGLFVHSTHSFDRNMHQTAVPTTNWVAFRAKAFFRATEGGRYILSSRMERDGQCRVRVIIDEREVFSGNINNAGEIAQGGINIEPGDYAMQHDIVCSTYGSGSYRMSLQVRSPSDLTPRTFSQNEIVHIARGNQRSSNEPAPGSATQWQAGVVRTVRSVVNVRQQPSTQANVVTRLDPGANLRIAALTSDREWAQVEVGGRVMGFIRLSALEASTQ
jgi:hypothetical protein